MLWLDCFQLIPKFTFDWNVIHAFKRIKVKKWNEMINKIMEMKCYFRSMMLEKQKNIYERGHRLCYTGSFLRCRDSYKLLTRYF